MDKQHILDEIRRTAARNGGVAPGRTRFLHETGIRESDWRGCHWQRWSDALAEAGLAPAGTPAPPDAAAVLAALAQLSRRLGGFPTLAQIRAERSANAAFPSGGAIERLGSTAERFDRLRAWCRDVPEFADVRALLDAGLMPSLNDPARDAARDPARRGDVQAEDGYVFLLQSGKHYRLGHTLTMNRGEYEQAIAAAASARPVHNIRTDDPAGILSYWQQRLAARKTSGEWYALNADEVAAFKRRKFM